MDNRQSSVNKRGCSCERRSRRRNKTPLHCHCRDFFDPNFAGLTDNLNYKLLSRKACELEMKTMDGSRKRGKTDHVGIDYVDMKDAHDHIVTFLKDKIVSIDWLSKDCRPDYDLLKHCASKFDFNEHHDGCDCWKHDDKHGHEHCHRKHHDGCDCWKHDDRHRHEDCHRKHHDACDCW